MHGSTAPVREPSQDSTYPYSITTEILEQRLGRPEYGRIWPQIFMGFLACISAFSFGTTLGWAYTVSTHLIKDRDQTKSAPGVAWLVSITLLGCSIGVPSCTFFVHQTGPKGLIRKVQPFFILTWWLMLINDMGLQMAGRFFLGYLGIMCSRSSKILLVHTVHFAIRKYLSVLQSCTSVFGILVIRMVESLTTQNIATSVCASLPIVHYILIQFVPESPVFLYASNHHKAVKSLTWYRGKDNIYVDMACIKKDWDTIRVDAEAYKYMMFSKVVYKAIFVIMALTFVQIFSGYFIFLFCSMKVWADGLVVFDNSIDAAIIGSCFVFTKFLWGCLHVYHPQWKIRSFLISSCLCSSGLLVLSYFSSILRQREILLFPDWMPMLFICLFFFFYDMGLDHYPKKLTLEYVPIQVYKKIDSLIQSLSWFLSFLNIYIFAVAFSSYDHSIMFLVFGVITFAGGLFCFFFVVEPRGKSLIQIQLEFGGNPIGTRGAIFNQMRHTI